VNVRVFYRFLIVYTTKSQNLQRWEKHNRIVSKD